MGLILWWTAARLASEDYLYIDRLNWRYRGNKYIDCYNLYFNVSSLKTHVLALGTYRWKPTGPPDSVIEKSINITPSVRHSSPSPGELR